MPSFRDPPIYDSWCSCGARFCLNRIIKHTLGTTRGVNTSPTVAKFSILEEILVESHFGIVSSSNHWEQVRESLDEDHIVAKGYRLQLVLYQDLFIFLSQ